MSINKYYNLAKNTLYPICRSITGKGTKKTLSIIKNEFPSLKIYNVSSRSKAFDWNVPDEWNVRDAYVLDKRSNKIIDVEIIPEFRRLGLGVKLYKAAAKKLGGLISDNLINDVVGVNINKAPRSKIKPSDHTPIEIEIN